MGLILFSLLVLGIAFRASTAEQRDRLFRATLATTRQVKAAGIQLRQRRDPFRDALRARTHWLLITPALVAVNTTIFVFMLFGSGALSDPGTLLAWGGNFGLRTTNGEWWRLVTSMFVHSGMVQVLINMLALVQIGRILERLVGRLAFAAVYTSAGIFAGLTTISSHPVAVSIGASGAVFGLYGLLLASTIWGTFRRSSVTIPLIAIKRLMPVAVIFILYNVANRDLEGAAELMGLLVGFMCGVVLARGVGSSKPAARRVAVATAVTFVIAALFAVPLRGLADVRPEIERVVAVENRTAGIYQTALDRFRNGRITAEALAQLIDRTIMPELTAADARLKALDRVPQEHQALVAGAEEYLRLRYESWRLRVEGLRKITVLTREAARTERASDATSRRRVETMYKANMMTLGKAESTERESLEALQKIRPATQK